MPHPRYRRKRDEAITILQVMLAEQVRVPEREIITVAHTHHLSRATFLRAKRELGVRSRGGLWELR